MHLLGGSAFSPDIALLSNGELGTLALGERDPGLRALANDENVGDTVKALVEERQVVLDATYRVANVRSRESLMWTISNPPMCFSR